MTDYTWRGDFANAEINGLYAQAVETSLFSSEEWDWEALVPSHNLGWVVARDDGVLVGLVNVAGTGSCMRGCQIRWCPPPQAVAGSALSS